MGIPYSREINAAFEQVTPLVAAGYKVLQTTKNVSILLAIIQVLTVFFLAMILFTLILLLYSLNPDLEDERKLFVTPLLRNLAHLSLWGLIKGVVSVLGGVTLVLGGTWYFYMFEHEERRDLEHSADDDADEALGKIDEGKGKKQKKQKNKNKNKGDKGKDDEKGKGKEKEDNSESQE